MYIPSWDFRIFELPQFSPLQAQEFGAETMFSANTPTSFIDFSINQLAGLTNPSSPFPYIQKQFPASVDNFDRDNYFSSFQDDAVGIRDRLIRVRDEANKRLKDLGVSSDDECKQGRNILGGCGPLLGSKKVISDGQGTVGDKTAPPGMATFESIINSIPQGAGVFIIGIVVVILLILFVKR